MKITFTNGEYNKVLIRHSLTGVKLKSKIKNNKTQSNIQPCTDCIGILIFFVFIRRQMFKLSIKIFIFYQSFDLKVIEETPLDF